MSRRRTRDPRTDEQIRASPQTMQLLAAVAAGEIIRGDGGDTSIWAPHYWRGDPVRMDLLGMRDDELINMPISGPPTMAPRGRQILGA